MDAKIILNEICTGLAGINFQTILKDPDNDDYVSQTVFRDDETAAVHIRYDARHVFVTLTMLSDEDFEHVIDALAQMNEYEEPDDGKELLNIMTLIPRAMDGNIVTYASAYLGLFLANDDDLTIRFIFGREDFAVFGLDTDELDVDEEEIDEEKEDSRD